MSRVFDNKLPQISKAMIHFKYRRIMSDHAIFVVIYCCHFLALNVFIALFLSSVDGDGKLDLLVSVKDNKGAVVRQILKFSELGKISQRTQQDAERELYHGYANSLTDLNNDLTPDLLLTAREGESAMVFEEWMIDTSNSKQVYELHAKYDVPGDMAHYGQSLFADLDSDGTMEHLLPACKDADCQESALFIYKEDKWNEVNIDFGSYGFIPPGANEEFWNQKAAMSVKAGDYDLNGYIDLLMVLRDNK